MAISQLGAATTGLQHTSSAPRQRHFRTSGSRRKKEVKHMRKARMMYLAGTLSLLAFHLGLYFRPGGMSDGGFY